MPPKSAAKLCQAQLVPSAKRFRHSQVRPFATGHESWQGSPDAKFAVSVMLPLTVTVKGLAVPVADPLQPVKVKPVAGVAVTVPVVPAGAGEAAGAGPGGPPPPVALAA